MQDLSARALEKYAFFTEDGHFSGYISSVLFDETFYYIQYFVIDTTHWLPGNMRLVSPESIQYIDDTKKNILLNIEKNQFETGPDVWKHLPISAQERLRISNHFGWPLQRAGNFIPVPGVTSPPRFSSDMNRETPEEMLDNVENYPLRSTEEIIGYHVFSTTDDVGILEDFIINTDHWMLKYFILKNHHFLKTDHIQISCQWINQIHWEASRVLVDLSTQVIQNAESFI
ncbi:hypothetical protein JW835_13955 [bacterium]|nr:hypothetical protein [bacterium]